MKNVAINILTINDVNVATPSEFTVGVQDISKAERIANGDIRIERIATKIKLEMSWNYLTTSELGVLLRSVRGSRGSPTFPVVYWDPIVEGTVRKQFYVGDRTAGMHLIKNGKPVYVGVAFNLIEV